MITPLPGCLVSETDIVAFCFTTWGHATGGDCEHFFSYCAMHFLNDHPDFKLITKFPIILEPRDLYLE